MMKKYRAAYTLIYAGDIFGWVSVVFGAAAIVASIIFRADIDREGFSPLSVAISGLSLLAVGWVIFAANQIIMATLDTAKSAERAANSLAVLERTADFLMRNEPR